MRLTYREHVLIAGGVVLMAGWALFAFGIRPALERIETLNRVIPEKESELERLRIDAREYVALREEMEGLHAKIASQEKTFELLPFIESLVQECGLAQNVLAIEPVASQPEGDYQEIVVEIEMENVTLRQLCDFLWKVRSSKVVTSAKRIYIKKNFANPDRLDSQVEIRNLKPIQTQNREYALQKPPVSNPR
jgi:type II secretory pathway component PulM